MHDDVAAIVAGLSNKQRAMLCRSRRERANEPPRCFGPANTRAALRVRGLGHGDYCYLTPLGLRVKSALIARGVGE